MRSYKWWDKFWDRCWLTWWVPFASAWILILRALYDMIFLKSKFCYVWKAVSVFFGILKFFYCILKNMHLYIYTDFIIFRRGRNKELPKGMQEEIWCLRSSRWIWRKQWKESQIRRGRRRSSHCWTSVCRSVNMCPWH